MRKPSRPLVLAVLVAVSPLAFDGCVSVGVDRAPLSPSGEDAPATGSVEVLVFETPEHRDSFRLVTYPVLSEIFRVVNGSESLVGRSMSAMWALPDLPPGRYRVSVTKRISPEGDIEPLKDPSGKIFDLAAGQKTTLRVVLKKVPTGWIVLGAIAAAALIYFSVDAASKGKFPPLPRIPPDVVVGVVLMATSAARGEGPAPTAADVFPATGSVVAARRVTVNFLVATPLAPDGIDSGAILAVGSLSGELPGDAASSLYRVMIGFLIGTGLAIPFGLAMGASESAYAYFNPVLQVLRPIPPIAYVPLAILWFGLGNPPAFFLISLGAFFPVLMNTIAGVRSVDAVYIRAARNLGANRRSLFFRVMIPAALPHILTGVRVGFGVAFIVVIVAEMIAVNSGLGYRILEAREYFWSDKIIAGMITIGLLGLGIDAALARLSDHLLRWHRGLEPAR